MKTLFLMMILFLVQPLASADEWSGKDKDKNKKDKLKVYPKTHTEPFSRAEQLKKMMRKDDVLVKKEFVLPDPGSPHTNAQFDGEDEHTDDVNSSAGSPFGVIELEPTTKEQAERIRRRARRRSMDYSNGGGCE